MQNAQMVFGLCFLMVIALCVRAVAALGDLNGLKDADGLSSAVPRELIGDRHTVEITAGLAGHTAAQSKAQALIGG